MADMRRAGTGSNNESKLVEQLKKMGYGPEDMAAKFHEAFEMARNRKMSTWRGGSKLETEGDISGMVKLMELWSKWLKVAVSGGTVGKEKNAVTGPERKRIKGMLGAIEREIKRRELPDILPGDSPPEDAAALQRMVEPGAEDQPPVN